MNNKVLRKLLLCMITIAMFALILNNRLSIGKETIETANTQSQSYFDNISCFIFSYISFLLNFGANTTGLKIK